MLLALSVALLAFNSPSTLLSRRQVVLIAATPLAASAPGAAHAGSPADLLFGWIPPVENEVSSGISGAPPKGKEMSTAEKIRARRKQLELEEGEKLMAEYQKNRQNSAASVATDAAGAARQ